MKDFLIVIATVVLLIMVLLSAGCKKETSIEFDVTGSGVFQGHEFVDLGLPSGTLWATCNVGNVSPDGYGCYFAWGETAQKSVYSFDNYKYYDVEEHSYTKYNFIDERRMLEIEDDAASINWGDGWCTPTKKQWDELLQHTSSTWTNWNGVDGWAFIASNGKSLFLPSGYITDSDSYGCYWSRLLDVDSYSYLDAWALFLNSGECQVNKAFRFEGLSVRPVRSTCINGHDYVDLDLPSGTLWATCNVGANNPEGYGDYFAWGETQSKSTYNWNTYKYCRGHYYDLTKYCFDELYGYNGFVDYLATLLPVDDAASVSWGGGWHTPTIDQWRELRENSTIKWVTQNGVKGIQFEGSNGNSIFLPAAGKHNMNDINCNGLDCLYWTNNLSDIMSSCADYYCAENNGSGWIYSDYRYYGYPVRPVWSAN